MGFSGISIWQLVIILVIVVLLFGTKRLGSLGSDLGSAMKGFKKAFNDDSDDKVEADEDKPAPSNIETKTEDKTNT